MREEANLPTTHTCHHPCACRMWDYLLICRWGERTPQQTDMGMIVIVFAKSKGAKHNSMKSGTFETPSAAMARRDSALESCYAFCGGRE